MQKSELKIATEAEISVLGTLIAYPEIFAEVKEYLTSEMFTVAACRSAADFIWKDVAENGDISLPQLRNHLKKNRFAVSVTGFLQSTDRTNFARHVHLVYRGYLAREDAKLYSDGLTRITEGEDPDKVFGDVSKKAEAVRAKYERPASRDEDIRAAFTQIVKACNNSGLTGTPTGYHCLDRTTGGWQQTNQIIVAGRPGMGKTTFVLCTLFHAAFTGVPALFVSLEMSKREIYGKLSSILTGISTEKMQRGELSQSEKQDTLRAAEIIQSLPIYVETGCSKIEDMKAVVRRYKRRHGIKIAAADYLQLCSGGKKGDNRNRELGSIVTSTKQLAGEQDCNLTWIWLSQLSRGVENRGGTKKPQMSDLRDSGEIEESADLITFVYRPEYYGILEDEEGNSLKNKASLLVRKNRHGKTGDLSLGTNLSSSLFFELSDSNPLFATVVPFPITAHYASEFKSKNKTQSSAVTIVSRKPERFKPVPAPAEDLPF